MKNKAKCKLCNSIIESLHSTDLQTCACGHIFVDAGEAMKCGAFDWKNFVRVDDEGNEIIPKVVDRGTDLREKAIESIADDQTEQQKSTKKELLVLLDSMRENVNSLPIAAMTQPISHYDFSSLLLLLSALFKADD